MIHSMADCLMKLTAIERMATQGVLLANQEETKLQFQKILQEISYLQNETKGVVNDD